MTKKGTIAGVVTDNAANCIKAQRARRGALPFEVGRKAMCVGCLEHGAQLLCKDLFKHLPMWNGDV
eukprot:237602-Lingulodinium_polyedra.AAC.1